MKDDNVKTGAVRAVTEIEFSKARLTVLLTPVAFSIVSTALYLSGRYSAAFAAVVILGTLYLAGTVNAIAAYRRIRRAKS